MTLILVKKTEYGYKIETASKSIPSDRQMKVVNKFIKHTQLNTR